MLHLNSSSPSVAEWDTNYARIYLKISEDQLEKINKIPGWSKTEISENIAPENSKPLENIEKQLTRQASTSAENISTTSTNISAKDNNLKNINYSSDIHSKKNPVAPLNEKELFLEKVSLRENHAKSIYTLKRSSSLPDLCEKVPSAEVPYRSNSAEIFGKQLPLIQKDISSFEIAPLLTKSILNKTYTVPGVSGDYLNRNKFFSSPLENPNQLSSQKFKTLDDSILCHKYLKDAVTSVFSNSTVETTLKPGMSSFEKKILLLEKRLSPSKEMNQPPFDSNSISLENLNNKKNLKLSQIPAPHDEIVIAKASANLVGELPDEMEISETSKSSNLFESQSMNENTDALKNTCKSAENRTDDASKIAACNFESFVSPPLPCGQPVLPEVISNSQTIPSQKSVELSIPSKPQNASPAVAGGKLHTEVPTLSQPILSQKVAKLSTPSKPQDAELVEKIASEKSRGTFSVFSANANEKVSHLASDKDLGTKRKRKSRSEKSSKKLKKSDIQFSSAQIMNMIEIMKIFHLEF